MKTPEELTGKVKRSGYLWTVAWAVLLLATSPSSTAQTASEAEQRKAELEAERAELSGRLQAIDKELEAIEHTISLAAAKDALESKTLFISGGGTLFSERRPESTQTPYSGGVFVIGAEGGRWFSGVTTNGEIGFAILMDDIDVEGEKEKAQLSALEAIWMKERQVAEAARLEEARKKERDEAERREAARLEAHRQRCEKAIARWGNRIGQPVCDSEILLGMTPEQVRDAWGFPSDINRTITAGGTSEQWVYSGNRFVYFENGVMTTIQD